MKNLRFTLFAVLIASAANAQFFQRLYGASSSSEVLESGSNYNAGFALSQKGYVMAGHTSAGSANGISSVALTRTNLGGLPFFNNRISLFNQSGLQVSARAKKVITLANGQIATFGDYNDGAFPASISNRFFLMLTDASGNPLYVRNYFIGSAPPQVEATSIVQSPTDPNILYVCGYVVDFDGSKDPFVMSVQAGTGSPNWGFTYIDVSSNAFEWTAEDLLESPYLNPSTGQTELAVVGRYVSYPGNPGQGSFTKLDAATGIPTDYIYQYGDPSNDAGFTAIKVANNTFNGTNGYVMAGFSVSSAFSSTYDAWAIKIDQTATVVEFSNTFDYSAGFQNDFAFDIIERANVTGLYEYYLGGYVSNGYFGNEDEVVYKLDYSGLPVANGSEFTYGGQGNDRVLGLSMFNTTSGSFTNLGLSDFHHVRSYFNGLTACNFIIADANFFFGPGLYNIQKLDIWDGVRSRSLLWTNTTLQNALICTATSVPGGANTRLGADGQDEEATVGTSLYPNPVSLDNPVLTFRFDNAGTGEDIDIEVMNSLGQLCMQTKETLGDGQTQLQLNIGANGLLSKGIYLVVIHRGSEVFTHKVTVQ
jgi:hypothetical protein